MYQAVFISDLHLNPDEPQIEEKWIKFLTWVKGRTQSLYILGDFVHAWAGDDLATPWSEGIASQLAALAQDGIDCYFMPGNRDFLMGERFAARARWTVLRDPCVIHVALSPTSPEHPSILPIFLTHGDAYCSSDVQHQWFRRFTRSPVFMHGFLKLPRSWRASWVRWVRQFSQNKHQNRDMRLIDVNHEQLISELDRLGISTCVHGHTHQGKKIDMSDPLGTLKTRYVLSDWDAEVKILTLTDQGRLEYFCFT